ncbi:NAD-dependent epimerase/dehydratase family protein [Cohnella sp. GCM10012308]|uniref:NAD-dependent epimerase/dehydratase family protein n=1 Tax=Cohnella sp. GCM10012308 TaxID=3317329 RepID=UPI0036172DD9
MRIVVIGGSGHVGSYMIPQLVRLGHEVVNVSRGMREPYRADPAWREVEGIAADRSAEEAAGSFGRRIRDLRPDAVVDMICYTAESGRQIVEALAGEVQHYLSCGTLWVHGHSTVVPATEELPRRPFGEYGIRKAELERYLLDVSGRTGFPATILHPGHIVGPGWEPLNPAGHFHLRVFEALASGGEVLLPNLGMETVHHVHAEDVAQSFVKALQRRSESVGNSFHVVSGAALTLRGYAEAVASWFGCEPVLRFVPFEALRASLSTDEARAVWDHIAHSPNASIGKARRLLGYEPRYTSLEAVRESLDWLIARDRVALPSSAN